MLIKPKKTTSNSRSKSKTSKSINNRQTYYDNNIRAQKVGNTIVSFDSKNKLKTQGNGFNKKQKLSIPAYPKAKKFSQKLNPREKQQRIKSEILRSDRNYQLNKNEFSKIHQTEANYNFDFEQICLNLQKIQKPNVQISSIQIYFQKIQQILFTINQPILNSLLYLLHDMYTYPYNKMFSILQIFQPLETLLSKKENLNLQIQQSLNENKRLLQTTSQQLQNVGIDKLNQMINQQKEILKQKKDIGERYKKIQDKYLRHIQKYKKRDFKIDLMVINKNKTITSFHDQFYQYIDQFSQSWRNQALKEKRF